MSRYRMNSYVRPSWSLCPAPTWYRIMSDSSAFQADVVEYIGRMAGSGPDTGTAEMRRMSVPNSGSVVVPSSEGFARGVIGRVDRSRTNPSQRFVWADKEENPHRVMTVERVRICTFGVSKTKPPCG